MNVKTKTQIRLQGQGQPTAISGSGTLNRPQRRNNKKITQCCANIFSSPTSSASQAEVIKEIPDTVQYRCHRKYRSRRSQINHSLIQQGTSNTDICHESGQNPLILPLSQSDFLDKKKAKLRIGDADWSAEFPLDTAGSSGRITCSSSVRDYEVLKEHLHFTSLLDIEFPFLTF
jgi:hypothetical protein